MRPFPQPAGDRALAAPRSRRSSLLDSAISERLSFDDHF